jgi:hypothetical protein
MPALKCQPFKTINGDNFELCDEGGKVFQLFTTTPSITTTTTSTTTTLDLINLKNAKISFITAIGVGIIVALTKKVYDTIKKTCASKAMEKNVYLENIQNIITQQTTTNIPAYDLEQAIDWNKNKI